MKIKTFVATCLFSAITISVWGGLDHIHYTIDCGDIWHSHTEEELSNMGQTHKDVHDLEEDTDKRIHHVHHDEHDDLHPHTDRNNVCESFGESIEPLPTVEDDEVGLRHHKHTRARDSRNEGAPVRISDECDTNQNYHGHGLTVAGLEEHLARDDSERPDHSLSTFCPPVLESDPIEKDPEPVSSEAVNNSDGNERHDHLIDDPLETFSPPPEQQFSPEDVNQDSTVDSDDFLLVIQAMGGQSGNPGAPAASHTLSDTLEHIKGLNITDPEFQRVIQLLEKRAAELNPKKTTLLANYPNPFNPETWIPYRLAKAADVTLTIYAVSGQPVRTLALGHQRAGSYLNRTRAAYWDGRNAFGEPVASGVYFYHLSAGDFSATRKMLVAK